MHICVGVRARVGMLCVCLSVGRRFAGESVTTVARSYGNVMTKERYHFVK